VLDEDDEEVQGDVRDNVLDEDDIDEYVLDKELEEVEPNVRDNAPNDDIDHDMNIGNDDIDDDADMTNHFNINFEPYDTYVELDEEEY
jgi:hypothetical protein